MNHACSFSEISRNVNFNRGHKQIQFVKLYRLFQGASGIVLLTGPSQGQGHRAIFADYPPLVLPNSLLNPLSA